MKPPSYASNTFQAGDTFYLTGSTIEFLGAMQEGQSIRLELYHYAWTSEVNGLSISFRSTHHPEPIDVIPQFRYKGFYTIKVDLDRFSNWNLVRFDVSNLDKPIDKIANDSNTKKIYLNETQIEKIEPAYSTPEEYAVRFYQNRIQLIHKQNQGYEDLIEKSRKTLLT